MAVHSLKFQKRSITAVLPSNRSLRIDRLSNTGSNALLKTTGTVQEIHRRTLEKIYFDCILQSPIGIPLMDYDFYCQKFGSPSQIQVGVQRTPVVTP